MADGTTDRCAPAPTPGEAIRRVGSSTRSRRDREEGGAIGAQGATLGRGTVRIPIWPVAVVVLAATAAVIGMSMLDTSDTIAPARPLVTVTDAQRLENSTAAIREQGAVAPVAVGISHVTPKAVLPIGISHVTPSLHASTGFSGLENPAASYIREASGYAGLENPTAVAPAPRWGPIMVNGKACMQCR